MKKGYIKTLFAILLTSTIISCGPGSRTTAGSPTTVDPNPPAQPTDDISAAALSFQKCGYYGYSASIGNSAQCINGSTVETIASVRSDQTKWLSGTGFLRLAEAKAYLQQIAGKTNITGSGVNVAIVGTGAQQVQAVATDQINISAGADFGYVSQNSISNSFYDTITNPHGDNTKNNWVGGDEYATDFTKVEGEFSTGADNNTKTLTKVINAYSDQDIMTHGLYDLGNGTSLASIISAKDNGSFTTGIASGSIITPIKTMFEYQHTYFINSNNSYSSPVFAFHDNTARHLLEAVKYAKISNKVLLINDRISSPDTSTSHGYSYLNSKTEAVVGTRSFTTFVDKSSSTGYWAQLLDQLNAPENIYIVSTNNTDFADLIKDTAVGTRAFSTMVAIADVDAGSITYGASDSNNINAISKITLGATPNIGVDCTGFSTNKTCFIAPGNTNTLFKDGTYAKLNSATDNEYTGAAYAAGAIAVLRGAYSEAEISNADLIAKLAGTATSPTIIRGCSSYIGQDKPTADNINCGVGMINLYEAVKSQGVQTLAAGLSVGSDGFNLANTSLSLNSSFGDGLSFNAASFLNKAVYLDDYGFTYNANLADRITTNVRNINKLDSYFADNEVSHSIITLPGVNSFSFNLSTDASEDVTLNRKRRRKKYLNLSSENDFSDDEVSTEINNFSFAENVTDKFDVRLGFKANVDNSLFSDVNDLRYSNFISVDNKDGYLGLVGEEASYSAFGYQLTDNIKTSVGYVSSEKSLISAHGADNNNLTSSVSYIGDKLALSGMFGELHEGETMLGSKGEGAFTFGDDITTNHYGLDISYKLTSHLSLVGSYAEGNTSVNANQNSVFKGFNDIKSRQYALGAFTDIGRTKLGFLYSEPMRVISGTATLDIPVGRTADGQLLRLNDEISLKPSGKERDLEFFMSHDLKGDSRISANVIHRSEPDHIKAAKSENTIIIKFHTKF
jgi:hypothetical protein